MNKKGQMMEVAMIAIFALIIILGGFMVTVGSGVLTYVGDEVEGITSSLGVAGDSNLSFYSDVAIKPVNTTIQNLKWGSGVMVIFGLLGLLIFAGVIRARPNGFLITLYLLLVIILVFTSIYISNTYEEILGGSDEIATELQTMEFSSFLILRMPLFITLVSFIGGIIIFSGLGEELA